VDPELQRLVDESAIRALLARYARGVDRMDFDLIRSCYHDDATDDHGAFRGHVDGYVDWLREVLPRAESSQHFLGTQVIEVDGDEARAETYCLALLRVRPAPDAPAQDAFRRLRYCDRLERRSGEWKIAERVVVFDHARVDPVELSTDGPANGMVVGTRDRADPAVAPTLPRR
jgi:hypothetical protein